MVTIEVDDGVRFTKEKFIIQFLEKRGEAYVNQMYRGWVNVAARLNINSGNYQSFRVTVNKMKREGKIRVSRVVPFETGSRRHLFPKTYYTLA